jgi:hypothetical protein
VAANRARGAVIGIPAGGVAAAGGAQHTKRRDGGQVIWGVMFDPKISSTRSRSLVNSGDPAVLCKTTDRKITDAPLTWITIRLQLL